MDGAFLKLSLMEDIPPPHQRCSSRYALPFLLIPLTLSPQFEWVQNVQVASPLAQVYSISWGYNEAAQCDIDTTGTNPCTAAGRSSSHYVNQTNQVRWWWEDILFCDG